MPKPDQKDRKALPGSFEERRRRLEEAVKDAGILPEGDVWITDTFDDRFVVSVWSKNEDGIFDNRHFEVDITAESDTDFEFGEVREEEK